MFQYTFRLTVAPLCTENECSRFLTLTSYDPSHKGNVHLVLYIKDTQNTLDNFETKPLASAKEQRKPRPQQIVKQYANNRISKLKKGKWKWRFKAKSFQQDSWYQHSKSCGCNQLIKLCTAEKYHYSGTEIKINVQKWGKGWKSLVNEKWRTASFRLCSLLLLTLQGEPGCALCKLYWNCIGINHMPEGSMACCLANDAVWYDGKEDF